MLCWPAMIKVLAHLGTDQLDFVDPATIPTLLADPKDLTWVDIEGTDEQEIHTILSDTFKFHPLTIEDCCNDIVDPPKVDDYDDYLFMVCQAIDFSVSEECIVTTEVNIYLGQNYLVSIHKQPLPVLGEVVDHCKRHMPHTAQGSDWLCHAILDKLVDQLLPVAEAIDVEIAGLEDQALERPDSSLIGRMGELKRSTLRLRWLVAPQRDVVARIARGDFPKLIGEDTHMYFRDIHDHL